VAERTPARTLQIDYYGRDDAELASQLLMLPPGRYRLAIRAEGDAEGEGSVLSWQVQCHPAKTALAALPLRKLAYKPRVIAVQFVVPASNCGAQWLKLVGDAGEFPKAQNATITALQIEAVH
jgi:hypothetical protein